MRRLWRPSGSPTRELEGACAELQVQLAGAREIAEAAAPEGEPEGRVGLREVDDDVEPTREGLVDVGPEVGGEDGKPVEALHPLKQEGTLDVGVPVVGVLDLGAFAEHGIGLVEEEDG